MAQNASLPIKHMFVREWHLAPRTGTALTRHTPTHRDTEGDTEGDAERDTERDTQRPTHATRDTRDTVQQIGPGGPRLEHRAGNTERSCIPAGAAPQPAAAHREVDPIIQLRLEDCVQHAPDALAGSGGLIGKALQRVLQAVAQRPHLGAQVAHVAAVQPQRVRHRLHPRRSPWAEEPMMLLPPLAGAALSAATAADTIPLQVLRPRL